MQNLSLMQTLKVTSRVSGILMRFLQVLLIATCLSGLTSAGYLAVFGPRTVQHREKFQVYLNAVDYDGIDGSEVKVFLTGKENNKVIDTHKIRLEYLNKFLMFDLSHSHKVQNYILSAETNDGKFNQSVEIFIIPKRYSVLVQTDKPVYKPGDKVNFRVVIINSEMKMHKLYHLSVEIQDKFGIVLRAFEDILEDDEKFKNGVFTESFDLLEEPVMGVWNIKVKTNDREDDEHHIETLHPFEVKEYVLPRFNVSVETKTDLSHDELTIDLSIFATYTFGELVVGTAEIFARVYDSAFPGVVQHRSQTKTVEIETKKMVSFNIKDDLKIVNSIRPYFAHFDITFTEGLTGQKASTVVEVRVFRTGAYIVNILRQEKRFKPGFNYNFTTIVKKFDGSFDYSTNSIQVSVMYFYTPEKCTPKAKLAELGKTFIQLFEEPMENGRFDFSISIPSNTTAITITAKYVNAQSTINVLRQESQSREYIKAHLMNKPEIGKTLRIRLEGNGEPLEVFSVITNQKGILFNQTHENFVEKLTTKVKITSDMAPLSFLTIYYIQMTGEIVSDQVKLEIEKPLPLKFNIELSTDKTAPGSKISMKLKAPKGSWVSILGVDESVRLLGTGNDIDNSRIVADMSAYNIFGKIGELNITGNNKRYLEFGTSNTFILTNALEGNTSCITLKSGDQFEIEEVIDENGPDGPEAEADKDGDSAVNDNKRTRKLFPETWFFSNFEIPSRGFVNTQVNAPDTITSFLVNGFAVHPVTGFGIAVQQRVTVFQNFFLKLFLPYSIRLGEILKVAVSVFNYDNVAVKVDVKMFNIDKKQQFKFVSATEAGKTCKIAESNAKHEKRQITIQPNSGGSTFFLIKPLITGNITIRVRATNEDDGGDAYDEIEKKLKVEYEGISVRGNIPRVFDLRNKTKDSFEFTLPIAQKHIASSLKIGATVVGDLIGPAFANIHNLIQMPHGCTEQTFKSWIPNIAAVKYLKSIQSLTKEYIDKSEKFLAKGYQEVLKRKQKDGSFRMWIEEGAASTWLTAYVVKVLGHAKEFFNIDDTHIKSALNFIKSKQTQVGNFSDPVATYYYISKTKTQTGTSLTAFVAIAVFESGYYEDYKELVDKCLTYLDSQANKLNDNLAIAISAYALALGSHPAAEEFVRELDTNAIKNEDKMFWYREAKALSTSESPSINVEIAAYAMMAYLKVNRGLEALKIMNFLMTQRNANGGFYSTTDTVIGIQALAMFAEKYHAKNINIGVKFSYENDRRLEFEINPENARVSQFAKIDEDSRRILCNAEGSGFAYAQVEYSYNTKLLEPLKRFDLIVEVQPNNNENILHLKICTKFIPDDKEKKSKMALIEANLPSGYVYDSETIDLVKKVGVRQIETRDQKTSIVLYFDFIGETEICPEIKAIRQTVVADLKQSVVKVYDYYNQNFRGSAYYKPSSERPCGF